MSRFLPIPRALTTTGEVPRGTSGASLRAPSNRHTRATSPNPARVPERTAASAAVRRTPRAAGPGRTTPAPNPRTTWCTRSWPRSSAAFQPASRASVRQPGELQAGDGRRRRSQKASEQAKLWSTHQRVCRRRGGHRSTSSSSASQASHPCSRTAPRRCASRRDAASPPPARVSLAQAGEAVELFEVGVRDRREVAAEQHPVAEVGQPRQQVVGVRRLDVEELGEDHRRVEPGVLVGLGEGQELGVLRRTHVRDHGGEPGVPPQQPLEVVRAGELVADRAGADVDHDRRAGVLDQAERLVEQRVVEPELPHLGVQLEDLDARLDQLARRRR